MVTRTVIQRPSIDDSVVAVLASPRACRRVLTQLGEWKGAGKLEDPKWDPLLREMRKLEAI